LDNTQPATSSETLHIGLPAVEIPLPESASDQAEKQTIAAMLYDSLVQLDDCHPKPRLAESWEVHDEGRRWTFRLRENVRFHDGNPCTAEDVVAACERLVNAEGPFEMEGPYVPYFERMEVRAADDARIEFTSGQPMGYLPEILAGVVVGSGPGAESDAIGTGPYRVEDYEPGDSLTLVESTPGTRRFPRVRLRAIEEATERIDRLKAGDVDLVTGLETIEGLEDLPGFTIERTLNTLSVTGFLNGFCHPFSDPRARLGINLAVDIEAIIAEVWNGNAVPATTIVSPNHLGYPSTLAPHPHDPEAARRLLEQVDMPAVLHMRAPHIIPDRSLQVAEMISENLAAIGVRVTVDDQGDRPLYAKEVGAKNIGHLGIFDSSPLSTYRVMWEKISSRARGLWWQGVSDETADVLIDQAGAAYSSRDRKRAYAEALNWLHENPHWLYLYHPVKLWAHDPQIHNIRMDAGGMLRLED